MRLTSRYATRELGKPRSIPLYSDQEERIKRIAEALQDRGRKTPAVTILVRDGFDLILDRLEKELNLKEED